MSSQPVSQETCPNMNLMDLMSALMPQPIMPNSRPAAPAPPLYTAPGPTKGMTAAGNTDLRALPVIQNPDGSSSTVYSTSFTDENPKSPHYGKNVLVKGILNGKKTDDVDALRNQYYKTGQHLGVFDTPENADAYASRLHEDWQAGRIPGVNMTPGLLQLGGSAFQR